MQVLARGACLLRGLDVGLSNRVHKLMVWPEGGVTQLLDVRRVGGREEDCLAGCLGRQHGQDAIDVRPAGTRKHLGSTQEDLLRKCFF